MEWLLVLAVGAGFLAWQHSRNKEKAEAATARLTSDNRLYQHIKAGMREYDWIRREKGTQFYKDGELIFENAHMKAVYVSHFAESRVGFYFKDINEYGMHSFFVGNGADEVYETYYRTDPAFKMEGRLLHDDD